MSERIEITFQPGEGAVLRMLGLVERRGFLVGGITMRSNPDRATLALDLAPRDPGRRPDVLARQLRRLVDVRSVAVTSKPSGTSA